MASPKSFLNLPVELRLRIYELVLHADVECVILQDIEHQTTVRNGTQAVLIQNTNAQLAKRIPWISLVLTCRTIAEELRSLVASTTYLSDPVNTSYLLALDVYNEDQQKPIRKAVWHSIPCAPDHAQALIIDIKARSGKGPWTEGGAASMARAIYQILNHFCHRGPLLIREKPLVDHIRIRDLRINIDIGISMKPPPINSNIDPRFNYAQFLRGVDELTKMGYLFRFVANIQVSGGGEYSEQLFMVDALGVQAVPGAWKKFGFDWGV